VSVAKFKLGTSANLATTELNSLASAALAAAGSDYNNTQGGAAGDGYTYGEYTLAVTFGSAPTAGQIVSVWLLARTDGTNLEDGGASVTPLRPADLTFPVRAVTTAQRITRRGVMPPGNWTALTLNGTSQAFPASGTTLAVRPYTPEMV
jgi:hypothetical protein